MQIKLKSTRLNAILVEDNPDDRRLFENAFSETWMKSSLLLFRDGLQFLNYLNRAGAPIPDIIFLDLDMPVMGGLAALGHLRRSAKYSAVPVAIYSHSSSETDILDALEIGANVYITKPENYEKLRGLIKEVIQTHWAQGAPATSMEWAAKIANQASHS